MANKTIKSLIIYYSYDGNTKIIAENIAKEINADLLELKLKKEIKLKGFFKYFILGMQVAWKIKPELLSFDKNPDDYDLIIIGAPVWAGSYASPFNTYFSKVRIRNKKVALFCCYGGGERNTFKNFKSQLKDNEIVGEIAFKDLRYRKNNIPKREALKKAADWAKELFKNI